jgi:hypothetical protein
MCFVKMAESPQPPVCSVYAVSVYYFFIVTGNLETVMKLVRAVDISVLSVGNVGGHVWAELKEGERNPPFSLLKKAKLWQEEDRFKKPVWSWLCEEGKDWSVSAQAAVRTQQGEVVKINVNIDSKTERLMCGELGAILTSRSVVHLLYIEVKSGDTVLSEAVLAAMVKLGQQKTGIRIILWGEPAAVQQVKTGPMAKLLESGGPLNAYRSNEIDVFLPKDDLYGTRTVGQTNTKRVAFLLSPTQMRPVITYAVSHVPWTPSIPVHLIHFLDITSQLL